MQFCHHEAALESVFPGSFPTAPKKLIYDPSTCTCYSGNISQASSVHIYAHTFLLRRNLFTLYSYLEYGLYSHFIPLIIYRLEEEVKGIFLRQFPSLRS